MSVQPVVELTNIYKNFTGVKALSNVDFSVYPQEIIGLVGENGAGKSTLMKILIGLYAFDEGEMKLRGTPLTFSDPKMAIQQGIGMVFQEGCLLPNLTIAENLFLCHEKKFSRRGLLSMKRMKKEAARQLDRAGLQLDPGTYVRDMSQASRQMVEIARLLWLSSLYDIDNPVMILDEPTTVLLADEIKRLFDILHHIKREASIIFISHRLEEVLELSDRIIVFKDGENMAELSAEEAEIHHIEQLMVGRGMAEEHYQESDQREPASTVVVEVKGLEKKHKFDPLGFRVHNGEILSLVGVLGSGKEDVCRSITGTAKADRGEIFINGKQIAILSPKDAIQAGIGYIPIDRRSEGLALEMDVMSNTTLIKLKDLLTHGLISPNKEKQEAAYWVKECRVKTPSLKTACANLSGGNQQKVVLAKWLAADVDLLILDHPTRGVDIGAKEEIYKRIRALADKGMAIILMSDTLEEDIGLCNRMIFMKDGKVTGEMACPPTAKPAPVDIIDYIV
ncbi:MAG: sugar ABC transporter ATP-binding protein [bacterium]|nr:sugar ABC transporter ATP-binding protein [bacterium]